MLDGVRGGKKDDGEMIFCDGILYIIQRWTDANGYERFQVTNLILDGQYDKPISLEQIAKKFPKVFKVIFEDALMGYVFNYGNHKDEKGAEAWELVGTTIGYA